MSDFRFVCPKCDQHLEAPEELLGQIIECPTCSTSIQLPSPVSHVPAGPFPVVRAAEHIPRPPCIHPDATVAGGSLMWVGVGESIEVGPYRINDAFTYVSDGVPSSEEASCIDLRLSVGRPVVEDRGALGYWPQYSRLTSGQRANYLVWLAGGRQAELVDVGYAFIYFYGLERHAFVDNEDIETVLTQANRLMCSYAACRALFRYISRFIAYVLVQVGLDNLPRESFDIVFAQSIKDFDEDTLAVALAWLFTANEPLPAYVAFEVAQKDIRASHSVVTTRVGGAFRTLFYKKYADRFGTGLQLRAGERHRLVDYKPASPTVLSNLPEGFLPGIPIPNVRDLVVQFDPLIDMWSECIEELKPLSREIGDGNDVIPREAYRALPDALKEKVDHPDRELWERFVSKSTSDNNIVITTVAELAPLCGFEPRTKLTVHQSEDMASTASDVGFVLVPDPRVNGRGYRWNEMVALFRPEGSSCVPADKKYRAAVLLLEMGMVVAASDGTVERSEIDQIIGFLKAQFLLVPDDARRIDAYKDILVKQPPVLNSLAKRLKTALAADHLDVVCQFLVGIAAANGSIDKKERTTLRRFYTALGLPISKLDEVIAKLLGPVPEAVEVRRGSAVTGERIPPRHAQPVFSLNANALQAILQETEQVAQMLGDALMDTAEDEAEVIVAEARRVITGPDGADPVGIPEHVGFPKTYAGLDLRYNQVVAELLARQVWTTEDFEAFARKHKVMPAGMLETINTWADENYGDFLIEEGDHYTVKQDLLEKT